MVNHKGLALAPWNVLARGKLRSDAEEQRRRETGEKGRMLSNPNWERTEDEVKMSHALEKVAKEVGASSLSAGWYPLSLLGAFTDSDRSSRHRLCDAKDTLRFPYCWRSQGRTSHAEY